MIPELPTKELSCHSASVLSRCTFNMRSAKPWNGGCIIVLSYHYCVVPTAADEAIWLGGMIAQCEHAGFVAIHFVPLISKHTTFNNFIGHLNTAPEKTKRQKDIVRFGIHCSSGNKLATTHRPWWNWSIGTFIHI